MSDWLISTLGDTCEIVNGGTPNTKDPIHWGGDFPWITPAEMGKLQSPYIEKSIRTLTDSGLKTSSASMLPPYSVILSSRAPIGHLVINTVPMATNQGCKGLIPADGLNFKYLYYFLDANRDNLNSLGSGTTFAELSGAKLKAVQIPLPPLDEQKRIVAKLDEASGARSDLQSQVEIQLTDVQSLKTKILEDVFNQKRVAKPWLAMEPTSTQFPAVVNRGACNVGGRPETERIIEMRLSLGVGVQQKTPRPGWQWVKLTDVAQLESGHTPSRSRDDYWGGSIPWLNIPAARDAHGGISWSAKEQITELGMANSAARLLPAGTVCLSRTASLGYVTILGVPMATDQNFVNWVCTQEIEPEFFQYLLFAENRNFSDLSTGSVHQSVYVPDVKAFYVCIPAVEEQRRVVSYLDDALKDTLQLEQNYSQKSALFDWWYSSLMSEELGVTG